MKETNNPNFKGKFEDFRPHRLVHDGSVIVEIEGEERLAMIKLDITKVLQLVEKGGQVVIHPKSKEPMYMIQSAVKVQLITREEYEKMKKSSWGLQ